MTRVMNIISDTNFGGAGRVILNYLRYADREQFEPLAALPRGSALKGPLEEAGARVYEVDGIADRSWNRADVKALRALLQEVKPDLVHTHGCLSGRVAARSCRLPVVYSRHSAFPVSPLLRYPPGRWVNKLVNELFADRIIAVSPASRDNLVQAGVSPRKITVVMNGTAPVPRTPEEERAALREELDIPAGAVVFGILARLEDYKGHLYLLEAAKLLRDRGRTGFVVLAAGEGPFEEELDRALVETGTEDQVRLLGFRSDVPQLLNILDVQLNCSYGTEATSMALLEGMSLGLPTIASGYGGNPWVVKDGETGLIFPSQDPEALSAAMERLMDHPEEREAMGRKARALYESTFTGEAFARNTENIYLDILKGAKSWNRKNSACD